MMPDRLVCIPLTTGELAALNDYHVNGGVVGEEAELDLERARDVIRWRAAEVIVSGANHVTPGSEAWLVAVERLVAEMREA
jgi:hypothetical protein